jgi:DNA-binding MarR family transcriptional regulator
MVAMQDVAWLDEREAAAWRGLQQMQAQLNARLAHELSSDSDLSYPDYTVLVALTDRPDGEMRSFELGQELGWEKSRVSHHVSRMVARGLVTRRKCPSDQRGAFVVVTEQGRRAIEAAAPGHVAAVRRYVIDRLAPDQLDALAAITRAVLSALAEPPTTARQAAAGPGAGQEPSTDAA